MTAIATESKTIELIDKALFFVYCDAKGHVDKFHIVNASISGDYLQGIKRPDNKFRTFRADRILESFADLEALQETDITIFEPLPATITKKTNNDGLEICFTGFTKANKAKLIKLASDAGMQVRDSVTKKLNFLCYGKNAGPVKVRKANEQGVLTLTSAQLEELILTGEIPSEADFELFDDSEVQTSATEVSTINSAFTTMRTLPRRQVLIANFEGDVAKGWRFKVHSCHRSSLDIKLTSVTKAGKQLQVWTQGHAFNFIGGELIESHHINDQPIRALQIKFTTPAGFETDDRLTGEFSGHYFKKDTRAKKVDNFSVEFNSQTYDEGMLTVDVFHGFKNGTFAPLHRIELTQVEFVTLLQHGKVAANIKLDGVEKFGVYDPFTYAPT